jgi:hypothetical protein
MKTYVVPVFLTRSVLPGCGGLALEGTRRAKGMGMGRVDVKECDGLT